MSGGGVFKLESLRRSFIAAAAGSALVLGGPAVGATPHKASKPVAAAPMPQLVEKDGRWALMVDGAPYLILGAQVNNSSAWPDMLPKVWPAIQKPAPRQHCLGFAHGRERKQVPLDVVFLVNIRLDQRHQRDARIAAEHVEHRHPAATCADLKEMGHNDVLSFQCSVFSFQFG